MRMISCIVSIPILIAILACVGSSAVYGQDRFDVVVYGATSAGVTSSIQAARMGKAVCLISTDGHIGGLTTSGLGATDINRREAIGGIAREFYARIYKHYERPAAWNYTTAESYFEHENNRYFGNNKVKRVWGGKDETLKIMWVFEPRVAKDVFEQMLLEAGVKVIYNERLDLDKGVVKRGLAISSLLMESGREIEGRMFIDATYEGDLMAGAGVSYFVGRESNAQYNETKNGIHPTGFMGMDITNGLGDKAIDPYIRKGDPSSGLLPFLEPAPLGRKGDADKRIQAYAYRVTLSNDPRNFRRIEKPENYNPLWFEHLARVFEINPCIDIFKIITVTPLPNRKTDINHCDFVGASYEWPEGDYQVRERVAQMHKDFALGKIWFLQNDPRVPVGIRKVMEEYGLPLDEFLDTDNFPHQLYIREARRMIGDYVITENDVLGKSNISDPIGLGTYPLDSHVVSHYKDDQDRVWIEGAYLTHESYAYPVSYKTITPKASECSNLLVPVCLSASHTAYSSVRMEPQYMVLGQSSALAACVAIDLNIPVQKVPYQRLLKLLLANAQILDLQDSE